MYRLILDTSDNSYCIAEYDPQGVITGWGSYRPSPSTALERFNDENALEDLRVSYLLEVCNETLFEVNTFEELELHILLLGE